MRFHGLPPKAASTVRAIRSIVKGTNYSEQLVIKSDCPDSYKAPKSPHARIGATPSIELTPRTHSAERPEEGDAH